MKQIAGIFIIFLFITACSVKPQPIVTGKDSCAYCKMTVMDKKFAAELITQKGRIYIFDDLLCLINFMHENNTEIGTPREILVTDFDHDAVLINAKTAYIYRSDALESPMNGHFAAHSTAKAREKMQNEIAGQSVQWIDIIK